MLRWVSGLSTLVELFNTEVSLFFKQLYAFKELFLFDYDLFACTVSRYP